MFPDLTLDHARAEIRRRIAEADRERRALELHRQRQSQRRTTRRRWLIEPLPSTTITLVQPTWRIV
jgi:hypothetical protein